MQPSQQTWRTLALKNTEIYAIWIVAHFESAWNLFLKY